MNNTTDASVNLIRALVENITSHEADWNNWDSMAIVIDSFDGRYNSASGFVYSADGKISSVAANPRLVLPAIEAYSAEYFKDGERLPVKFLVQFDRRSGQYTVTFEETDETRWKVTPHNYEELRESLRPTFTDQSSENRA